MVDTSDVSPSLDHDGGAASSEPHGALFIVLGYLRLSELISFHRVCRSLRDAIAGDSSLWRDIAVEPPLSGKLTDDALWEVSSKAEGTLRSLALLDCWKITDAGLQRVVDVNVNPLITKLFLPGCVYLTADGVVKIIKTLFDGKGNLKHLRLRGLGNITEEHLSVLNSLVHKQQPQEESQPFLYTQWRSQQFNEDDGRSIDLDMCPKCNNVRLVFHCTRENCRLRMGWWTECRGCFFCIPRCEECSGCVSFEEFGEDTACCHLLCSKCWLQLPKCNTCNRPYCKWHMSLLVGEPNPDGFICSECMDRPEFSLAYD